jgi:hypothetical protein
MWDVLEALAEAAEVFDEDATTAALDAVDASVGLTPDEVEDLAELIESGEIDESATGYSGFGGGYGSGYDPAGFSRGVLSRVNEEMAAIDTMSPAELDAHMARLDDRMAIMDGRMRVDSFVADVHSDVAATTRELAEEHARSFVPDAIEPYETGLTVWGYNYPIDEHDVGVRHYRNDVIETDGKLFRKWFDGAYHPIDIEGNFL